MFNDFEDENEIPKWRLTNKELKSCQGFDDMTGDQLDDIIDSLVQLALVGYYSEKNNE